MGLSINDTAPDFEADTIQGRMSRTTVAAATVVAVLLADGWHRVVRGSFTVGPLDFAPALTPTCPASTSKRRTTAPRTGPPPWSAR